MLVSLWTHEFSPVFAVCQNAILRQNNSHHLDSLEFSQASHLSFTIYELRTKGKIERFLNSCSNLRLAESPAKIMESSGRKAK